MEDMEDQLQDDFQISSIIDPVEQADFIVGALEQFDVDLGAHEDVLEGIIPRFLARKYKRIDTIDIRNGRCRTDDDASSHGLLECNNQVRRSLSKLLLSRVWKRVYIDRCDSPTLFVLIQTMLRENRIKEVEMSFYDEDDPIESVSESVVAPLRNGFEWTSALESLSISAMCLATEHDARILAEGLRHCSSLKSLDMCSVLPSNQAGALALGQGIGKNEAIQSFKLHSEGEDAHGGRDVHLIEAILAQVATRSSPIEYLAVSGRRNHQPALGSRSLYLLANDMILNQLCLSDYGDGNRREDKLDVATLFRALRSTTVLKKLRLMMSGATTSDEVELMIQGVNQCESLSNFEFLCYDGGSAYHQLALALPHLNVKHLGLPTLDNEYLGVEGVTRFVNAAMQNPRIERLKMGAFSATCGNMRIRELIRQVNIHCHLNKVRRHVQLANGLNPNMWSLYVARANQLTFEENGFENEQGRAQIIYDFLQHEPTRRTRSHTS
jgi:hypothetical protein